MRDLAWGLSLVALLGACNATVDGGEIRDISGDSEPDDTDDPGGPSDDDDPADEPALPGDDPGDEVLPAPPAGPAGTCWGDVHFDQTCSRDRASVHWETALFPGDASMAAMVSSSATSNAAIVSFGPAGAASSARWSDALVAVLPGQADNGRFGALRLVVPAGAGDSMDVVHANAESARNDWRDAWQDTPTGVQSPGFGSAYYEVDGQVLTWQASPTGNGVALTHTVELAGVQHVHTVQIGAGGATVYEYRRVDAGVESESWTSADGRSWHGNGGEDEMLDGEGEQLGWPITLPAAFAAEGVDLVARHAAWGPEMGWLEGQFSGLTAPFLDGFGVISELWMDVETAAIRSFTVTYWDGSALHQWDASDGGLVEGEEFPATYQTDRGSRIEVLSEGAPVASVEAIAEEAQVRLVVEDLLPVGTSIATSWRWEIVFESHDALPTGEVAIERTDGTGCARQLSYDFGVSWAVEACR